MTDNMYVYKRSTPRVVVGGTYMQSATKRREVLSILYICVFESAEEDLKCLDLHNFHIVKHSAVYMGLGHGILYYLVPSTLLGLIEV